MVGFFQKTLCVTLSAFLFSQCDKTHNGVRYQSENLKIEELKENVLVHESYLRTNDFGKVKCNGAIFKSGDEAIILDTPTNDQASEELIQWVRQKLNCKIVAVIPTHFHDDCLGGIRSFTSHGIKSYASVKTVELAEADSIYLKSDSFDNQLRLKFGNDYVSISFLGRGHTYDNVVAYYPNEKSLFGGCLIKSLGAGKGFLGDADTLAWSETVRSIQSEFKDVSLVIPGHGKPGNSELLDYTSTMFDTAGK